MNIEILYKDKNLIAVKKPIGVAVQPDPTGDLDLMTALSGELRERGERSDLWLVHRLDRVVGGVVVFAANKKYAAILSELASGHTMVKEYLAVAEGSAPGGIMKDYLYKDAAKGKAFVVSTERRGVKEAVLEYEPIAEVSTERGVRTLVKVRLHTGRFHQIRVQFASRGLSLVGDGKYGSRDSGARTPALFASRLEFPYANRALEIKALPDITEYPWSLFADRILEIGDEK